MKQNLLILIFSVTMSYAQSLDFLEKITENQIAPYDNQKLILIDFWATWCAPCIFATQQLENYQEVLKDKYYMIALSDETSEVVKKRLISKPIKLSVCIDFNKNTFHKFNVNSRPFVLILNTYGKKIWEGHPSELDLNKLNLFWHNENRNFNKNGIDNIITFNSLKNELEENFNGFTLKKIMKGSEDDKINVFTNDSFHYKGPLKDLLLLIKNLHFLQIETTIDAWIDFRCDYHNWINEKKSIENQILEKFELKIIKKLNTKEVDLLKFKEGDKLWNDKQINWGHNFPQFVFNDNEIQGNNMTVNQIANLLSQLKNKYFYYNGDVNTVHDWMINYKYDELFFEQLKDEYGITIEKQKIEFTVYEYK